jgi:DnaK suppressor protein
MDLDMESGDCEKVELKIISEIEKTQKDIDALSELIKPIPPDNAVGRLSRMEAISTKSINEAALGNARVKIGKLKWALSHVHDPEFGFCIECGEPIPIGRILLMPETALCVMCAEEKG